MKPSLNAGLAAALALLSLVPASARAQDFKAGDLVIQHPWARATPKGAQVAGGYLTISNQGAAPDTLTGGSLALAAAFEVHDMTMDGGVMKMRPAGPLVIPAGGSVTLSPAGTHIMFTGLKRDLRRGEEVDGTLTFAHAGTVPLRFTVESIGAKAPSGSPAMPGMTMH